MPDEKRKPIQHNEEERGRMAKKTDRLEVAAIEAEQEDEKDLLDHSF